MVSVTVVVVVAAIVFHGDSGFEIAVLYLYMYL